MIITGDHRTDVPNMRLDEVADDMKLPQNIQDVVIENDVWIGARALIVKGITIHAGSVIAAGAVVLEDVPQNTIYYSKGKTRPRFAESTDEKKDLSLSAECCVNEKCVNNA